MELIRWSLAERFGWTLPEVDALTVQDLHDLMQIDDARHNAAEEERRLKRGANG